ncbi:MAG: YebC/PmpR family DNA-binding transcriptional regulator [Nitrospinae bacterium]|nr:YebC/PmpR family DNA-binding transcriptional regulator [Nitrospinota bacterium]
MSGHSKLSSIKHKKAAQDAKRGAAFTKVIKELTVAARLGGSDVDMNPRLRTAVLKAKAVNMPQDNIQRAIMKGTGELPGVNYEEMTYEGYGPGGVAVILNAVTDNRNRTVAEIRRIFSKNNANLGETGCVAWMFQKKGLLIVEKGKIDEDALLAIALEAGAEDVRSSEGIYEVVTAVEDFETVKQAITAKGIEPSTAEVSMIPQSTVRLEGHQARQLLKLMEELEEHEDVQNVYGNFDIPDEVLAEV